MDIRVTLCTLLYMQCYGYGHFLCLYGAHYGYCTMFRVFCVSKWFQSFIYTEATNMNVGWQIQFNVYKTPN